MRKTQRTFVASSLLFFLIAGASLAEETVAQVLTMAELETEGNWMAQEDGSIYLEPRPGEKGWKRYESYLWFPEELSDFEFDFEYKHEAGGNSGFYFRVADRADPVKSGVELQIKDSSDLEKEPGHHDLGGIIKTKGADVNAGRPNGEWNTMKVSLKGTQFRAVLNGKVIQDVDLAETKPKGEDLPTTGYLCLQDHGLKFWVRNLRLKKL